MTARHRLAQTAGRRPVIAIEVNENMVLATGLGADWWVRWRYRASEAWERRFEMVKVNPQGGLHRIRCDDAEDARELRDMLIDRGLPKTAVRIVRDSAA